MADGLRLIGAVDAEDRRAEVQRAGTHRITGAAGHEARQVGLTRDHLWRRTPVRPLGLAADPDQARPLEALAADPDPVAQGTVVALNQIGEPLRGMDDEGAGQLAGPEVHRLTGIGPVADDRLLG